MRKLLTILDGCPQGATAAALHSLHRISERTMSRALDAGYVTGRVEHVSGMQNVRLHITEAGRSAR